MSRLLHVVLTLLVAVVLCTCVVYGAELTLPFGKFYHFAKSYGGIIIDAETGEAVELGFREDFRTNVLKLPEWLQLYEGVPDPDDYLGLAWDGEWVYLAKWGGSWPLPAKLLVRKLPVNISYPFNTRVIASAVLRETAGTSTMVWIHLCLTGKKLQNMTSRLCYFAAGFGDAWAYHTGEKEAWTPDNVWRSGYGTWDPGTFNATIVIYNSEIRFYLGGSLFVSTTYDMSSVNITGVGVRFLTDPSYAAPPGSGVDVLVLKLGFVLVKNLEPGTCVLFSIAGRVYTKCAVENNTLYVLFDPAILPADIDVVILKYKLPRTSFGVLHSIAYSPRADTIRHSIVHATNTSAVTLSTGVPSAWGWTIRTVPYTNNTGYIAPDRNATITGYWVSGTVQNLADFDNVYYEFKSYNDSNTMRLVLTLNVTTLGWLAADSTLKITEIEVVIAGNLSKTVNARASLEILDWSTGTWTSIDDAALNQTSNTQKVYRLSQVLGGDLSRFISSTGVIAFRINVTDVQAYPSTYVYLTLDQLVVKITYVNETHVVTESLFVVLVPYGEAVLRNITLVLRANGTGAFRTVSLMVYGPNNTVVLSKPNVTFTTNWTTVVLNVNTSVTGSLTVILKVNMSSSLDAGEEIDIAGIKLVLENFTWYVPYLSALNSTELPCPVSYNISLTNMTAVNTSRLVLYLRAPLVLEAAGYPGAVAYIGNTTVNSLVYNLYLIEQANRSGTYVAYLALPNELFGKVRAEVHGVPLHVLVVGDVLCVVSEIPANITMRIGAWSETWPNTTSICLRINETGQLLVTAWTLNMTGLRAGYMEHKVLVGYGALNITLVDYRGKPLSYEEANLTLVDLMRRITRTLPVLWSRAVSSLYASNYSIHVYFMGVEICRSSVNLNTLSNGTVLELRCSIEKLSRDYRGIARTLAWPWNVSLVWAKSLSRDFPWSRMSIAVNGTGPVYIVLDYETHRPTAVKVEANVSSLAYRWSGNVLIISGVLGSVGVFNVTDLYRLRVVYWDRLNNTLSVLKDYITTVINRTIKLRGHDVSVLLYPAYYVVEVPADIRGFKFYSFFDGYNETTRVIVVNMSDVRLDVWYRVPTEVEVTPRLIAVVDKVAKVFVEGHLRDYYGYGVPNRPVYVMIQVDGNLYTVVKIHTDAGGYYSTPVYDLPTNVTVTAKVVFPGDDIYVESSGMGQLKIRAVAPPPPPPAIPTVTYVPLLVALVLAALGFTAGTLVLVLRKLKRRRARARTPVFA